MTKQTTPLKTKLLLLFISSIIAIILLEVLLRIFLFYSIGPSSFVEFSSKPIDLQRQRDEGYDQDQHYERFLVPNALEIISLGDSFTNGGNVPQAGTYPVQLYELSQKKLDIINMGVCEDTTYGAYVRLKKYLETTPRDRLKNSAYSFVLIGAADYYNPLLFLQEKGQTSKQWIAPHERLYTNPLKHLSGDFLTTVYEIKTYKLLYFIFKRLSQFWIESSIFHKDIVESSSIVELKQQYHDCFQQPIMDKRAACIKLSTEQFILNQKKLLPERNNAQILAITAKFYYQAARDFYNGSPLESAELVMQGLLMMELYPQLINSTKFLEKILLRFRQQNIVTAKQLIDAIKKASASSGNERDDLNYVPTLLKELDQWISNDQFVAQKVQAALIKIIELLRTRNITPVLMTYPLEFKLVNATIRSVAKETKVDLIDFENLFGKLIKRQEDIPLYIDSFDHATNLGYQLMAKEIFHYIQNQQSALVP